MRRSFTTWSYTGGAPTDDDQRSSQARTTLCNEISSSGQDWVLAIGQSIDFFEAYLRGVGYSSSVEFGPSSVEFGTNLFRTCINKFFTPGTARIANEAFDTIRGCSNAAEATLGLAWAEQVGASVGAELLLNGYPPIESVHVDALVNKCLQQQVTAADHNTLSAMRKNCAVAVPLDILNGNDAVDVPLPTLNGNDAAALRAALAGCLGANAPAPERAGDELVVAAYQPGEEDPASAACPCGCPAPPADTSPSVVASEPPPSPPATPAPAAPAVATRNAGRLWHVNVQASSGSTSTWTATWTSRPGTGNEFDVKQTRFDGSVTTYSLRVTIGTDNKVTAQAFGDMQGASACSQLTLAGTLVGNTVSDGTYACIGYKGTWQGTVEGR